MITIPKLILIYYLIINAVLLVLMGIDKIKAKKNKWRIPESTLFSVSVLGGSLGGLLGIFLFNHKKNKISFYIIFILSTALHLFFIFTFLKNQNIFNI